MRMTVMQWMVSLNFIPISTPDMSLNIGMNYTHNENKLTKLLLTDDPEYIGVPEGGGMTGSSPVPNKLRNATIGSVATGAGAPAIVMSPVCLDLDNASSCTGW